MYRLNFFKFNKIFLNKKIIKTIKGINSPLIKFN